MLFDKRFLFDYPFRQFFTYALVGLLTNFAVYLIYLVLTYTWGAPKLIMTVMYVLGASLGFFANRRFTFPNERHSGYTGIRYTIAYISGYLLNLLLLLFFVDWLGFQHQIIQAIAIVIVSVFSI